MRPLRFDGKVAFITGAGHGIGRATALRLASEGAAVLAMDLRGSTADAVAAEIREAGGRVTIEGSLAGGQARIEVGRRLARLARVLLPPQ